MSESIAVLIPCYNEAVTIAKVVDDFKRELPEAAIYVYDNNSKDDTGAAPGQRQRRALDVPRHRRRLLHHGRR